MPTSSKPDTSAIHRVLLDSGADPKLIHPAIEEIRQLSGENVVTAIGAQITKLRSEMQVQITKLRSEMQVQLNELRSEMKTQINGLQAQINELRSEMQVQLNELRSEMQVQINELRSEMKAQNNGLRAEINTLSKVIWPLITLLFIPMLALAYKLLTQ